MEVLVQWVLMLLAILGLVQLGEMICLWSRRPKKRPASFSVLPVSGRLNDPQTVLDYFEQVAAWSPESCLAFVIDCGLDEESAAPTAAFLHPAGVCAYLQRDTGWSILESKQKVCEKRRLSISKGGGRKRERYAEGKSGGTVRHCGNGGL